MTNRKSSLLVVDDNEMNRDLLSRRLMLRGYQVQIAESGCKALETISRGGIDLVLLDIEMPDMSGLEVLSQIRKLLTPLQLPVIMVTGRADAEDVVQALNLGANDYITKPVELSVAVARITTHLSLKWMDESLRESEQRYAIAAQGANDGLWDWNLEKNEIYFSPRWKSMLGYADHEIGLRLEDWFDRVHPEDRDILNALLQEHLEGRQEHFESEHRILHSDGTYRWVVSRGLAVRDKTGKPTRMAGSQRDVTLDRVADPLTGIPNRLLFMDRLNYLLGRTKRDKDYRIGVLALDLDNFKVILSSLGPDAGDKLLIETARRLESSLRSADTLARFSGSHTLARIIGDEFSILLDDIKTESNAILVVERLISEFTAPFLLGGQEVFSSACIGITLNNPGYSADDLLRNAETALNWAKADGKGCYRVFDVAMQDQASIRLKSEADLRRALENNELINSYQTIVSVKTGQIVGMEALVRWHHPQKGIILPDEFIPLAEETGLILEIDRLVLQTACSQLSAWQKNFSDSSSWFMSSNISAKQLMTPNFVDCVAQVLKETKLEPRCLKLEITERIIVKNMEMAQAALRQLNCIGVQIAIDDFGTGYSSLSYLQQFCVDTLKIDRSFLSQMEENNKLPAIVATIVLLAHDLGLDVVAEGVETVEQLKQLEMLGCEYAQGYYFAKPLPAQALEALFKMSCNPEIYSGAIAAGCSESRVLDIPSGS